jgi:putative hemolysin
MALFVASVAFALLVSFCCSLLEAVLLSLTPSQIGEITLRRPRAGAMWQDFKANIDRPIAAILIFNTGAHTVGATVAGAQFNALFGAEWIVLFSLGFTYLMLQFSEILPKTFGVRYNRDIAVWLAQPLATLTSVMRPVVSLVHWVNKPFEGRRAGSGQPHAVEEITALAGLARISNQISGHQERIIHGATRLSRMKARDVMIPAEHLAFLSTSMSIGQALIAAHLEAHTRFPVCDEGRLDHVVGYVNFKELVYFMRTNPNAPNLRGIIRPLYYASPDESSADLLRVFVDQHIHMAIVRDAGSATLGLVTLEDLVEELVGEIEDEFDRLPRMSHSLSGGTWMMGGGVTVEAFNATTGANIPDERETISSWIIRRLGRLPKAGEVVEIGQTAVTVRRVRRGKVFEVMVVGPRAAGSANAGPPGSGAS